MMASTIVADPVPRAFSGATTTIVVIIENRRCSTTNARLAMARACTRLNSADVHARYLDAHRAPMRRIAKSFADEMAGTPPPLSAVVTDATYTVWQPGDASTVSVTYGSGHLYADAGEPRAMVVHIPPVDETSQPLSLATVRITCVPVELLRAYASAIKTHYQKLVHDMYNSERSCAMIESIPGDNLHLLRSADGGETLCCTWCERYVKRTTTSCVGFRDWMTCYWLDNP